MTRKRLLNLPNLFFLLFLAGLLWPAGGTGYPYRLIFLALIIEMVHVVRLYTVKRGEEVSEAGGDVIIIIFAALLIWHLATARFKLMDTMLFPAPEGVLALFIAEVPDMLKGLVNSLILLVSGYAFALVTAVPLGLVVGWRRRLFEAVNPFTKVLGPIPPTVYIPYAIALLPTFRMASIFVIFVGAFWPLFINTVNGVFNIERTLIDSALVLRLKERTMLFKIILPGALPSIASGATLALVFSFILLTAAELIGATSGIGWYVKNFADFADYRRVVVGIIFIGFVVTAITFLTEKIERRLLRWKQWSGFKQKL